MSDILHLSLSLAWQLFHPCYLDDQRMNSQNCHMYHMTSQMSHDLSHKCHMTSYKCHMTSYKCHMTILDQRRATWEKKKILLLPIRKHCMVSSFLRNVMNRNWKLKVSAHIEVHHCYTSPMIYHCGGEPEQAVHCWFNVMALKPWICVHVHLIRTQLYVLWSLTSFHRAYVTANPAAMHCLCATTKY